MRYITKYYYINEIPVIEIIEANLEDKEAPLVVFYHGFTSNKDASMTFGNEIAKRGFRVVMPDANHHGGRRQYGIDLNTNGLLFFGALMSNVMEFPEITNYFQAKNLIKDDFIGVSGMSMGGMTTSMIFKANASVKAAVVLMGTPQQIKFNDWTINQYVDQANDQQQDLITHAKAQYEEYRQFFKQHDLSQGIAVIQERPLLFWHAKQDPVVPYVYTEEFVEQVKKTQEGKNVHLKLDNQGGHKVPFIEMARMAEFLYAAYTKEKEEVFETAEERIKELWG